MRILSTIEEESTSASKSDESWMDTTNMTSANTTSTNGTENNRSKFIKPGKINMAVHACQTGDLGTVEFLLKDHLNSNERDEEDCTLLHWAAINNQIDIMKLLLSRNADINAIGGYMKATPLHWACYGGSLEAVITLTVNDANPEILNNCGESVLHIACRKGNNMITAYLLAKFEKIKDWRDHTGQSALMVASLNSYGMFPIKIFVEFDAHLDFVDDKEGNTALHNTVKRHDIMGTTELLVGGASTSQLNNNKETAMENMEQNQMNKIHRRVKKEKLRRFGTLSQRIWSVEFLKNVSSAIVIALIVLIGFFLFHYLNFFAGIAFSIIFGIVVIRFFMTNVLHDLMWIPSSYIVVLGFTEEVVLIFSTNGFIPWWIILIMSVFWTTGALMFFKLILCNPGKIKRLDRPYETFIKNVEQGSCDAYCFTCWVPKPPNSHHCSICDMCVLDFDHHCPWLNKCVYRKNMRLFVLFIFFVLLFSSLFTPMMAYYLYRKYDSTSLEKMIVDHGFIIMVTLVSITHIVGATMIFYTQLSQISVNMTTIALIRKHRKMESSTTNSSTNSGETSTRSQKSPSPITNKQRLKNIWKFLIHDKFGDEKE